MVVTYQFCRILLYEVLTEPDEHRCCLLRGTFPVTKTNKITGPGKLPLKELQNSKPRQSVEFVTLNPLIPFT